VEAVVVDDDVAGTIGSWGDPGEREATYWLGRSHWGTGIATRALTAFLALDRSRPLHARVASDNVASRRVLEKCGFVLDHSTQEEDVLEHVLVLTD